MIASVTFVVMLKYTRRLCPYHRQQLNKHTGDTNIIYDSLPSTCHTPISLVKMVEGVDIFHHPKLHCVVMTNYFIYQK